MVSAKEQYPDTPYWKMAARFGQLVLEAHLRWGEETLAGLSKTRKETAEPHGNSQGKE